MQPKKTPSIRRWVHAFSIPLKQSFKIIGLGVIFTLLVASNYFAEIVFSSESNGLAIPAEITFHFDLDGIESENVYVKTSAMDEEGIKVDPLGHKVNASYKYPGFFKARLLVDNKTVKTSDVFIKTDGWLATWENSDEIVYLEHSIILEDNKLAIPRRFINRWPERNVTYHYFDQINPISGLFFNLQAELKTGDTSSVCHEAAIEIVGSNSNFSIPLSMSACSLEKPFLLGGTEFFPDQKDINYLSAPGKGWQKFKLIVDKGLAKFRINNKEQLTLPVNASMGQIVGLRFHFSGPGEVKDILLTDTQEITYVDVF